jgi:hypothetical protein
VTLLNAAETSSIESDVLDSVPSYLTVRLIQNFCINIIYFFMTYFIIRDILILFYLFYNLQKKIK